MIKYLLVFYFFSCSVLYGATCTTTSTTTWDCGTPTQNDDLIVNHDITITGDFTVNSGSLTVIAPNTITITGNLTFNNLSTVLVQAGAGIRVNGNFLNKNNSGDVEIFGTLEIDGNFENGTGSGMGAEIDVGGTGTITYGGTCSNSGTVSDDDGSYTGDCNNPVLPVELVNFRGTAVETGNLLQWETASERNNDFFAVERSGNTQNWETIARVAGQGDSDQIVSYEFLDARPLTGRVFYRLRQVDFDGAFEYSYIISVVTGELPQFQVQRIYPNPASGEVTLSYISNNDYPVEYRFFNETGQLLKSSMIDNYFGSNEVELTLPLHKGIITVVLQNQDLVVTRKIISDF